MDIDLGKVEALLQLRSEQRMLAHNQLSMSIYHTQVRYLQQLEA